MANKHVKRYIISPEGNWIGKHDKVTLSHLLEWPTSKMLHTTNTGKDVQQLEFTAAYGDVQWYSPQVQPILAILPRCKHKPTFWRVHSIPRCLRRRNLTFLQAQIFIRTITGNLFLIVEKGGEKPSIHQKVVNQTVACPYNALLLGNKNNALLL